MSLSPPSAGGSDGQRVSPRQTVAYALGAVTDMIGFHGPVTLVNPIFNVVLGLNPSLIGVVKAVVRLWDAFTDPWMGAISDRGLGPHGRRKPFIVIGALAMGVTFFLMWNVPRGLGQGAYLAFISGTMLLFYTAFTVFTVPYHGLGYELADTYHDRTRVMAWRLAFNMVGNAVVAWLFAATQLPWFSDTLEGVYYVGAATAIVIVGCGLVTGLAVRERPRAVRACPPITVRTSIRAAWGNRPFIRLIFIALAFLMSVTLSSTIVVYVSIYYVYRGDLKAASVLGGISGTVGSVLAIASAFGWTWLHKRMSKRNVLLIALGSYALLSAASWQLYTPAHPYLQLVHSVFSVPIIYGFWLMLQSMIADTCDYEELLTGARREAVFGGFLTWFQKVGVSLAFMLGGLLIDLAGFDIARGMDQLPASLHTLRLFFAVIPAVLAVVGAGFIWRYPLDAKAVAHVSAQLHARRNAGFELRA